jgi:hypothetical protein
MNTITQEELQSLRDLNQSVSNLKTMIADYDIKKHYALDKILRHANELNSLYASMEEKYGKIEINLETGEYVNQEDINRE